MKTVIGIPTGQRTKQAIEVVKDWQRRGIEVAVLTWDNETAVELNNEVHPEYFIKEEKRYSFGVNQNLMMRHIEDWDVFICGADDLWSGRQPDLKDRIELVAEEAGDRLIWVRDGLFNQQPTHPIITRAMFEAEKGVIFNELYKHNFVDTDLFARMLIAKRVIKCFDISFDHRHYTAQNLVGKTKEDEIYRIGMSSYPEDAKRFHDYLGDKTINVNNAEEVYIDG